MPLARSFSLLFLFALVSAGSTQKAGDAAPPFSLPSATGATVTLKDYEGKSVVLVFYRGYW